MDKLSNENVICINKKEHSIDIKSFELGFKDGISVFISSECVYDYSFLVTKLVDVVDDPLFTNAYMFDEGFIKIDATCLNDILSNDCIDDLSLNNIKIEYTNDYPIHSDIPFMLLLPSEDAGVVRLYSEEDGIFTINRNYEK